MAKKEHDSMEELEQRILGDEGTAAGEDEYGTIHHPKKHLLTGRLYALALAAVIAGAALFTRLFI